MRTRTLFLVLLLVLASASAFATHIVGGEFSVRYNTDNGKHNIKLTLYFDLINGQPGALDSYITVSAFSTTTNQLIDTFHIERTPDYVLVQYTNPSCANTVDGVKTRVLTYEQEFLLADPAYLDPKGFYIVHERCCRNGTINNILGPGNTGQAFYLEFPALKRNGVLQINSSPALFPPLSDFACVGRMFDFDFSGTDDDGDSLAYKLVTPYAGTSSSANPKPAVAGPYPYRLVSWSNGYNQTIEVQGDPPLTINNLTGQLTLNPSQEGLFVFAVEVHEYRKDSSTHQYYYLGKVRREFQLKVNDCPVNTTPDISVVSPVHLLPVLENDTIVLQANTDRTCFSLSVADTVPDNEFVTYDVDTGIGRYLAIGSSEGPTYGPGQPFNTRFCLRSCAGDTLLSKVFGRATIRVRDDACSRPNKDSLHFYVVILPPISGSSIYITKDSMQISGNDTLVFNPGKSFINVFATDSFPGINTVASITPPLPSPNSFTYTQGDSGPLRRALLTLNLPCGTDSTTVYKFKATSFTRGLCGIRGGVSDSVYFRLRLTSNLPTISLADSLGSPVAVPVQIRLLPGHSVRYQIKGEASLDTGLVQLVQTGGPQNAAVFAASQGVGSTQSPFMYVATCEQLNLTAADSLGKKTLRYIISAGTRDCIANHDATAQITILLGDTIGGELDVPNVLTANGDALNATFKLRTPRPENNCTETFDRVDVYNRWGARIYCSTDIDFGWTPNPSDAGVYFYRLRFGQTVRRGWLEVVR